MAKINRFEELESWKTARKLTVSIYRITGKLERDFSLKDQIRRASLSIMNNIAEGFTRFSSKEKIRFLEIAQSSGSEVKSMFYLMEDLEYIDTDTAEKFRDATDKCQKQIWGLIKYLKTT
jgi:four helix bundle protein